MHYRSLPELYTAFLPESLTSWQMLKMGSGVLWVHSNLLVAVISQSDSLEKGSGNGGVRIA